MEKLMEHDALPLFWIFSQFRIEQNNTPADVRSGVRGMSGRIPEIRTIADGDRTAVK
jgi:hypothetical protein